MRLVDSYNKQAKASQPTMYTSTLAKYILSFIYPYSMSFLIVYDYLLKNTDFLKNNGNQLTLYPIV